MERIPADSWQSYTGHVVRYKYAADNMYHGECVNDIACGTGYGSELLATRRALYVGYDKPDVVRLCQELFIGAFVGCDLNSSDWEPCLTSTTVCFETLEHVEDPKRLAEIICSTTSRAIFVSAPTQPTKHMNPYHLHDFAVDDIPPMFPDFTIKEMWAQPEELSHVWYLERQS